MSPQAQPNLLITTSILDSYAWFRTCPPSWRTRAYNSLVATIRREGYTPHKTAQRGIDFENAIYRCAEGGSEKFQKIANYFKGASFQRVIKRHIEVEGRRVLLYGKVDALRNDVIGDIKTTENYRGDQKYLSGWQHKIYTLITGIPKFEYYVVLLEAFPGTTIIDSYQIPYTAPPEEQLLSDVQAGIWDFYEWLMSEDLFYDYEQIFSNARRKR